MKIYELKFEPVTIEGVFYPKYNIYYYINGELWLKEFYNTTGIIDPETIRYGFVPKQ